MLNVVVVRIRIVLFISRVRFSDVMVFSCDRLMVLCLVFLVLVVMCVCMMDECRYRLCGIIVVLRMLMVRYSGLCWFMVCYDGISLVVIEG